jgi:hypothetical protein
MTAMIFSSIILYLPCTEKDNPPFFGLSTIKIPDRGG